MNFNSLQSFRVSKSALQESVATPLFEPLATWPARPRLVKPSRRQPELIYGSQNILSRKSVFLQIAALACDSNEAEEIAQYISEYGDPTKIPCLLLLPAEEGEPSVMGYAAAVFLFEYRLPYGLSRIFGRSRVLSSSDVSGRRNVFAPRQSRAQVVARAARFLFENGHAHMVRMVFNQLSDDTSAVEQIQDSLEPFRPKMPGYTPVAQWSLTQRPIKTYLPLESTFDATLERIGKTTRWNLRYYRRRTERDLGCVFVPCAEVTLEEFIQFNRDCSFAAPDSTERYHALSAQERPLFAGIKDRDGRWLALVGGRRRTREIEIDWQMNREDLPLYSLATVLRSCLIEHEVELGTRRLYINGGTPQRIGHYFMDEMQHEFAACRTSRYAAVLGRTFRKFLAGNRISEILEDDSREWHSW
jgi:hypothetical protein